MAKSHLPNIRVISTPVANVILLNTIAMRLRSYYEEVRHRPVPERIDQALRRLS